MSPGLCTCPPHSRAGSGVSAFLVRCKHAGWAPKLASRQVNPAFEQDLHIPRTQNKPTPPQGDRKGAWCPNFKISEGENSLFQTIISKGCSIPLFSSLFFCCLQDRWFPSPLQAIKQNFLVHSYHHIPQGHSRKRNITPKLQKSLSGEPQEVTAEGSRHFRELLSLSLGLFSTALKANISQEWKHGFQESRCKEKQSLTKY